MVMDSLDKLLKAKHLSEPAEIRAIKQFVQDKYQSEVGIVLRTNQLVIIAPSASLIGSLRLDQQKLKQLLPQSLKISFRIGAVPT